MGPLQGLKIIEFAGLGAAPFGAMLLADLGADIIRIDRAGAPVSPMPEPRKDLLNRGRKSILIDLKAAMGRALALKLIAGADGLIESYRPGVMEGLGLSPDECLEANPELIYGRLSGMWLRDRFHNPDNNCRLRQLGLRYLGHIPGG